MPRSIFDWDSEEFVKRMREAAHKLKKDKELGKIIIIRPKGPVKKPINWEIIPPMVFSPANNLWWGQNGVSFPLWKWKFREVKKPENFGKPPHLRSNEEWVQAQTAFLHWGADGVEGINFQVISSKIK